MIPRYSVPKMEEIWSEENKFRLWLEIELLAAESFVALGIMAPADFEAIRSASRIDIDRINEIENEVHHDVIAFLTSISEIVGDAARLLHFGLTSSDILDTTLAYRMKQAGELLIADLEMVRSKVEEKARLYKNTPVVGRTHGVHAEVTTFGLKLCIWYEELGRHLQRLRDAVLRCAVGKMSGAVGTFAHLPPEVEEFVCRRLDLHPASVSSQIVQRDRHAEFMSVLALLGSSIEKFAVEIRHLQRTEVGEAAEPFGRKQKGSSAMPHKRNPIVCERLSGMARLLRGYALTAMENIPLWHERDISHSSVERIIIPDGTIIADYMVLKLADIVSGLDVYQDRMVENLNSTGGLIYSQALLLALVREGLTREQAYEKVQKLAFTSLKEGDDFTAAAMNDRDIRRYFSADELSRMFAPERYLTHVDDIFHRTGME
jgi:adenylosuccinate lyase